MSAIYDAMATTPDMSSAPAFPDQQRTPKALDKPLPSLPSPTLTNPDMVLPSAGLDHLLDSPGSLRGPPSISYLRDITNQEAGARASMDSVRPQQPKKEKRGLMSRKMMLLRSRTASSKKDTQETPQPSPVRSDTSADPPIASSPTIHENDRLAPQEVYDKRASTGASSFNSEEFAALPSFLSKYKSRDETEDEDTDTEKPTPMRMGYSCSIAGGTDAQRKAQDEQEEQNSAMLSQRAEQILANAKKRLNLMEGNLRGARDLVAPLTAANLKRAASLGSAAALPGAAYGTKRFLMDGYTNSPVSGRGLHAQASTPSLGKDYQQGHARTQSENTVPERPHTALARGDLFGRKGRIPVRPSNSSWTDLRGSQSFESLRGGSAPQPTRSSPAAMGTPDLDLEPLPEESASQTAHSIRERDSAQFGSEYAYGLGISRSPSMSGPLKEQMSSLKGRISSLRDRAKEDSIRRQSFNNLRDASPLNNAEYQAPEVWYSSSPNPVANVAEPEAEPSPPRPSKPWGSLPLKTGSRNAFAEIAAAQQAGTPTLRERRMQNGYMDPAFAAIDIHHQGSHRKNDRESRGESRDMPGSFDTSDNDVSDVEAGADSYPYSNSDATTLPTPELSNPSEYFPDLDTDSVYEDAEPELPSNVVPHEEREDAFDYEHFFLHSAMQRYQQSSSPVNENAATGSGSDTDSVDSVSTAKGPTTTATEIDPLQDYDELYPPPTPETPETLREIERRIAHSRNQSTDTVSTVASFATAVSQPGRASPTPNSIAAIASMQPRPASRTRSLPRPSSRTQSHSRRTSVLRKPPPEGLSPLLSPLPIQDPTTIAVNALLDDRARCLGLKDKALVFGVVESLRKVCGRLQEGDDEGAYDLREWRRRLDGARRVLDGAGSGGE